MRIKRAPAIIHQLQKRKKWDLFSFVMHCRVVGSRHFANAFGEKCVNLFLSLPYFTLLLFGYTILMKLRTKSERDSILREILGLYPMKKIELHFETPFQLLVAVMLSAQMTDIGVNKATKELFNIVKNPTDLLKLSPKKLEWMLRGINYYHTKTKHIFATAKLLVGESESCPPDKGGIKGGLGNYEIPDTLDKLIKFPGVGIKTAKVVLSHLYDTPVIGVDTHIHRVMNRMGIVHTKTPQETDEQLEKLLTDEQKRTMHHAIVLFGRYVCTARKCKCSWTKLEKWCRCEECK